MAKRNPKTKTLTFKGLFAAHTNADIWVRLLILFFIVSAVGVTVSLLFFLDVRGIGNRVIEPAIEIPEAREVNKEEIHSILAAFSVRESVFLEHLANGVSIPDPY